MKQIKGPESYLSIPNELANELSELLDQVEKDAREQQPLQRCSLLAQVSVMRGLINELSTVGISVMYARSVLRALGYIGRAIREDKEPIEPTVSAYKA